MGRRGCRGFSLIELLITVALIGIIAAISIPGLMTAIQRSRQKRTVADLRNIGTAIETYVSDEANPPNGSGTVAVVLARPYFTPEYIKNIPTLDGWSQTLRYNQTGAFTGGSGGWSYSVFSYGRYGVDDLAASFGEYDLHSFHFDIYLSDGHFTCIPMQK